MTLEQVPPRPPVPGDVPVEHHDVVIVGAGLSGIGAACQLARRCPQRSVVILEARHTLGGTWDLFRYPGIRSDSDMHTLGYAFRPWQDPQAIADGPAIRQYIQDTAHEYQLDERIRFQHKVLAASWDSALARWTLTVQRGEDPDPVELTCSFLYVCSGYFRYDQGYTPPLPGLDRFGGTVVHPQHWPDELDYEGKRVLVIGSGATAVTLVPALARRAEHVTMLQRSPTYISSMPSRDRVADQLRRLLPERAVARAVRWKNVLRGMAIYGLSRRRPQLVASAIRRAASRQLPPGYDVATHFSPRYQPWDQRICLAPGGDFFHAIRRGTASVVTDHIDTFTEDGVRLQSGRQLTADVVVTATGLNLLALGGIQLTVDGTPVDLPSTVVYKGTMLSGVPNLALTVGYTNASWTLKADLVAQYVCRLLNHLSANGYAIVTPLPPPDNARRPFLELNSGYVRRSLGTLPQQGDRPPWRLYQNYLRDLWLLRHGPLDDGVRFATRPAVPSLAPAHHDVA